MRKWQLIIKDTDHTAVVRITNKSTAEAIEIYRELKTKFNGFITLKAYGQNIELSGDGTN